jgi:hypothetical protein
MKEALILAGMKRVGTRPLERLAWAADFSQRPLLTPGDQLNAELELACFLWAPGLRPDKDLTVARQINAIMTDHPWKEDRLAGQEVAWAQQAFTRVLRVAAGEGKIERRLKYVKVEFTRADGVEYVSTIPDGGVREALLEAVAVRLLRLLDKTVRTSLSKAKGGERFTPVRLYVGLCPEAKDGCGNLFAKTRFDQDYCSRTCASRAQVNRFRRNQRALKQLYPGKRMKQLTTAERARLEQLAKSFAQKKRTS